MSNPKIVITRSAGNASETATLFRENGFDPIIFPLLKLSFLNDAKLPDPLDNFDWIIFTSANAVEF